MNQHIKLADIRFAGILTRVKQDVAALKEYETEWLDGSEPPPIDVYHELGQDGHDIFWLGDGWHRVTVATVLEKETIAAEVLKGGKREALEHSLKSNWHHGVRRTNADKHRAVELALADDVWKEWSNRQVAKLCGVGEHLVAEVRQKVQVRARAPVSQSVAEKRVGADGRRQAARKSSLTPSNGKASTDVSFDVPAIEAKPAKPGRQKIKPADRKAALKAFGQLVRALDKMLISADVEQQMQDILHAIKGS